MYSLTAPPFISDNSVIPSGGKRMMCIRNLDYSEVQDILQLAFLI